MTNGEIPIQDVEEIVERLRQRADNVEKHGLDSDDEKINERNEWNIGTWRSVANEIEANLITPHKTENDE